MPGREAFLHRVRQENPEILTVRTPKNLGYFGSANFGFEHYCRAHPELPRWVVVSNVDLQFLDNDFFANLQDLEGDRDVGVVAPRIWSKRWNSDINPKIVHRPARRRMLFYRCIFASYFLQNSYELLSAARKTVRHGLRTLPQPAARLSLDQDGPRPIYAPHGSCMVFHGRFFLRGGTLKYGSFLFGEEIFVAETARKLGLSVVYFPKSWVMDDEHASTGIIRSRRIARYMSESTTYLVERYWQ